MSKKAIQVNEEDWHKLKVKAAIQKKPIAEVVAEMLGDQPVPASGSSKKEEKEDGQPS